MTDIADSAAVGTVPAVQAAADATESADQDITPAEPETPASDDVVDDTADRGGKDREAAKYRTKLRATEAERDTLTEQLTAMTERVAAMQRGDAERLAAEHLADGADLWRDGLELAAVLDEAGNLDPEKVQQAARATAAAHRHWATRPPVKRNPVGRGGFHSGATSPNLDPVATSWAKVLNTRAGDD